MTIDANPDLSEWLGCRYDTSDPMIDHYEPSPVTTAMSWHETMEWLVAHGYRVWIWPTEMSGGCVSGPSGEPIERMSVRSPPSRSKGYVLVEGMNALYEQVVWVYDSDFTATTPREEWNEYQQGSELYRFEGAEEPEELPYGFWPHIALCVR